LSSDLRLPAAFAFRRKDLNRLDHSALIGDDRFAQRGRPIEVGAHHLHDVGIVEQRFHRVVPLFVDGKLGIGLALVEKPIGLHELQRIGRSRQNDRDQIVRIKRNPADELFQILSRRRGGGTTRRRGCLRDGIQREDERNDSHQQCTPWRSAATSRRFEVAKTVHHACSKSWWRFERPTSYRNLPGA